MLSRSVLVLNTGALAPEKVEETKKAVASFLKNQRREIKVNIGGPSLRHEILEGRKHLVAPMVMLTTGVHAGSQGPILYEDVDLEKSVPAWNHKPIVVYHPTKDGQPISAADPDVLNTAKIGLVLSSKHSPSKLASEAWLDEKRTGEVDQRILDKLNNGEMIEISTGLYTDNEETPGVWNGEPYTSIARNHRPDHLAVLPDKIGACSIADGGGLLRNSSVSFEATRALIQAALREASPTDYYYVEEVFPKFFVYTCMGEMYMQSYTATDTKATLVGEPVDVVKVTQYRTPEGVVVGNRTHQKESNVNKAQLIAVLMATAVWKDEKVYLEAQSEERLKKLVDNVEAEKKLAEAEKAKVPATPPVPTSNTAPVLNTAPTPAAPRNMAQWLADAPPEAAGIWNRAVAQEQAQRVALINTVKGSPQNRFSDAYLAQASVETLQGLAALAAPVGLQAEPQGHYGALGGFAPTLPTTNDKMPDPLPLPTINWTQPAGK